MDSEADVMRPVTLSARAPVAGQSLLSELEQYWYELRGARRLPVRTEVNPAQIDAILPYSFILERVAQGVGRMRVAGQRLNGLLGMDARGMPLSAFFTPAARIVLATQLERVFDLPALVEIPLLSPRSLTRSRLSGQMLILPLLGTDGTVSRALGAIMTDGTTGQHGRQFDIPADGRFRCEALEPPQRSHLQAVGGSAYASPLRDRRHLTLIVSNG